MFTTFKANDVPLFVDGQQFETPVHYGKIMGYDKPLNLRWEGGHTQSEAEARRKEK
jgi:transmembrane protein 70